MDAKNRYEIVFEKHADHDGMVLASEFEAFLHECDLWPSPGEILRCRKLIYSNRYFVERKFVGYTKMDAIEMIFNMFTPPDAGVRIKRESTWLYPVVQNSEAVRILFEQQLNPPPPTLPRRKREFRRK